MRLVRLANLLDYKYRLMSQGGSTPEIVNDVKKNIVNAYNLYVNSKTAKEPILQMLADAGEPFSKSLISILQKLVSDIHSHNITQLFTRINNMLGMIKDMRQDKNFPVRSFIHDAVRATKQSEVNYREHLKSKFETIIHRLSSVLEKQAKELQKVLPLGAQAPGTPLEGGATTPQRKELGKDKLLMFMRSPAAQLYKLDNIDVMRKILSYPETKGKLTTLINAIDRGHIPLDGPEVMMEAQTIRKWLENKEKTNLLALEQEPEKSAPTVSLFEEEDKENK